MKLIKFLVLAFLVMIIFFTCYNPPAKSIIKDGMFIVTDVDGKELMIVTYSVSSVDWKPYRITSINNLKYQNLVGIYYIQFENFLKKQGWKIK